MKKHNFKKESRRYAISVAGLLMQTAQLCAEKRYYVFQKKTRNLVHIVLVHQESGIVRNDLPNLPWFGIEFENLKNSLLAVSACIYFIKLMQSLSLSAVKQAAIEVVS